MTGLDPNPPVVTAAVRAVLGLFRRHPRRPAYLTVLPANPHRSQMPWSPYDVATCKHERTITLGGIVECLRCRAKWASPEPAA